MYIYMCILSQKGDALGNKYISEFLYLNSKATGTSSWNEFELLKKKLTWKFSFELSLINVHLSYQNNKRGHFWSEEFIRSSYNPA